MHLQGRRRCRLGGEVLDEKFSTSLRLDFIQLLLNDRLVLSDLLKCYARKNGIISESNIFVVQLHCEMHDVLTLKHCLGSNVSQEPRLTRASGCHNESEFTLPKSTIKMIDR